MRPRPTNKNLTVTVRVSQKANKEARKIIIQTIQRTAAEQAIENAITVFNLESDEIKGQIIGREGRNIRAIEAATGVDLIVDDTLEAIILSSFDPLRREIARLMGRPSLANSRILGGTPTVEMVIRRAPMLKHCGSCRMRTADMTLA